VKYNRSYRLLGRHVGRENFCRFYTKILNYDFYLLTRPI